MVLFVPDFVYEPGQFAIRGGILDIYSFGNEKPYRIELFGNEVDSIRIFDPESQLSERKLLQVNIIPNVETRFVTGEKVSLLEFLPPATVVWMNDWTYIQEKIDQHLDELEDFIRKEKESPVVNAEPDEEFDKRINVTPADFVSASQLEIEITLRNTVELSEKPKLQMDLQYAKSIFIPKHNQHLTGNLIY
jgi:transcription-repair coupling factor (superfamily II helicase)